MRRESAGISLAELLMVTVVLTIFLLALVRLFSGAISSSRSQDVQTKLREDTREALNVIASMVRAAGAASTVLSPTQLRVSMVRRFSSPPSTEITTEDVQYDAATRELQRCGVTPFVPCRPLAENIEAVTFTSVCSDCACPGIAPCPAGQGPYGVEVALLARRVYQTRPVQVRTNTIILARQAERYQNDWTELDISPGSGEVIGRTFERGGGEGWR